MLAFIFEEILQRPFLNALVFLYQTVSFYDLGIAIIVLTVLIRFLLYPLSKKAIASQKEMIAIQPEVKKLQERYKNNKEEQMKRVMALYKEKKVNPFAGCLPLLVQLPIIIALYWVFLKIFQEGSLDALYGFVGNPGVINHFFLGFIDMTQRNLPLALLAGALQFWQSKMILDQQKKHASPGAPRSDMTLAMSRQMTYIMPVLTVFIAHSLHAGIAIYWATTTAFSVVQQWLAFRETRSNDGAAKENR
jgi:YidC/Oxa1 family membrane protein insertase